MSNPKPTDYVGGMWNEFRSNDAVAQVSLIERFYLRYLTELACNRFIWSGLPDENSDPKGDIRPRYMELTLFRQALVVFFHHKKWDKFLALRATNPGELDMYFDPTAFNLYGNGTNPSIDGVTVSAKDAVPIWANYLRAPDLDMVSIYTRRMAQFDRTMEINLKALRHPYIIAADPEQQQSVMNVFRQIEEGQPVIPVRNMMADNMDKVIKVLDLKVDAGVIDKVLVGKKKVWQECMTVLGINNANQDKKERLVADEVSANDSEVLLARAVAMDAREYACEQINKRWNLNVKVEWNTKIEAAADMPGVESSPVKEGDDE